VTQFETLPLDWDKAAIAARRQRYLAPALGTFVAYDDPVVWRRGSEVIGPRPPQNVPKKLAAALWQGGTRRRARPLQQWCALPAG
jgi:hypothetical protein